MRKTTNFFFFLKKVLKQDLDIGPLHETGPQGKAGPKMMLYVVMSILSQIEIKCNQISKNQRTLSDPEIRTFGAPEDEQSHTVKCHKNL